MTADLSRDSFQPHRRFSKVLMQQGRVTLDADWNEQTSILLHHLRALASDVIGPHGGPTGAFEIVCDDDLRCDVAIGWGHYYVDGILCEHTPPRWCRGDDEPAATTYATQPDYPIDGENDPAFLRTDTSYLLYLDVWERQLTHVQVADIREVALGGPDTAARAQVVWQVRAAERPKDLPDDATCDEWLAEALPRGPQPCLRARARVTEPSDDPCVIPPEAAYRGPENQLYRVEIHGGGTATGAKSGATFTWSRDNGSDVYAIRSLQGATATLDTLGSDTHRGLKEGTWVEVVDDRSTLRFDPWPLLRVDAVDHAAGTATLDLPDGVELPVFDETSTTHPLLRRWDQPSDAIAVQEGVWVDLEDGVQVRFEPGGDYRTGDHWMIPARTATRDVLWPVEHDADGDARPRALAPDGIVHHHAPLAQVSVDGDGVVTCDADCRCTFDPLCAPRDEPDGGGGDGSGNDVALAPVSFDPDSAELDLAAAGVLADNAKRLEQMLDRDPRARVEVHGVAGPGEGDAGQLARNRAGVVADVYARAGVPRQRMRVTAAVADPSVPQQRRRRVDTIVRRRQLAGDRPAIDVPGIGRTFAARLDDAGVTTAAQVAELTPDELAELLTHPDGPPVTSERAATIIAAARELVAER